MSLDARPMRRYDGATVTASVVGNVRGKKLYIQKFKRRKNMRRRTGFRAHYTEIRVDGIQMGGKEVGENIGTA